MKEGQPDRSPIPDMEEADQANGENAEPAAGAGPAEEADPGEDAYPGEDAESGEPVHRNRR